MGHRAWVPLPLSAAGPVRSRAAGSMSPKWRLLSKIMAEKKDQEPCFKKYKQPTLSSRKFPGGTDPTDTEYAKITLRRDFVLSWNLVLPRIKVLQRLS